MLVLLGTWVAGLVGANFLTTLFGYWSHYALHQSWSGKLNRAHMTHHQVLYDVSQDPDNYLSETYRDPGGDNTVRIFAALSLPVLAIPIILGLFNVVSWWLVVAMLTEMLFIGYLHDMIHDAFHLRNHWLYKLSAFRRWSKLHFVHHLDMSKNYGIYGHLCDRIFGTFNAGDNG
jgi:sterol desaturase/sphingolipid hydroxylase (fatty acid hydroxylase superfamily)